MRLINNKLILIAIISFILGAVIMYAYTRTEANYNKKITRNILDNCIQSMTISDSRIKNCAEAYNTVGTCVANPNTCNGPETVKKLDQLNLGKQRLEDEQANLTRSSGYILEEVAKNSK